MCVATTHFDLLEICLCRSLLVRGHELRVAAALLPLDELGIWAHCTRNRPQMLSKHSP